jgi:hypothetical protein
MSMGDMTGKVMMSDILLHASSVDESSVALCVTIEATGSSLSITR